MWVYSSNLLNLLSTFIGIIPSLALLVGQTLPLCALVIGNKYLFTHGYNFPLFVTACNFLSSACVNWVAAHSVSGRDTLISTSSTSTEQGKQLLENVDEVDKDRKNEEKKLVDFQYEVEQEQEFILQKESVDVNNTTGATTGSVGQDQEPQLREKQSHQQPSRSLTLTLYSAVALFTLLNTSSIIL